MPKFLDVHPMKGFDEETIKKWSSPAPVDEFVSNLRIFFTIKKRTGSFVFLMLPIRKQ